MWNCFRLATLKHALPLIDSLDDGLNELVDWISEGERLVEEGKSGSSMDIQQYAQHLQVNFISAFSAFSIIGRLGW